MNISDRSEEILEALWVQLVEGGKTSADTSLIKDDEGLRELQDNGCVQVSDNQARLTDVGHEEARGCIRRHRLAERLLSDVLRMKEGVIHEVSCDFEHALHKGVDENVCTLLGHPRTCPHGSNIPEGACCKEQRSHAGQLMTSLSALSTRNSGIVAYLRTDDREDMQKLIAMGLLPGTPVQVLQRFPTIAFQAGKSQFAVDRDLADKVIVRQSAG
mgnify:CR=1 FL=1